MANPTFIGSSSAQGTGGTSHSVTVSAPGGIQQNDLIVALIVNSTSTTFTAPSGFGLVASQNVGGSASKPASLFYKFATASEPTSYTFNGSSNSGVPAAQIVVYRGSAGIDAPATSSVASATSLAGATTTTSQANETVIAWWIAMPTNAAGITPPGGVVQRASANFLVFGNPALWVGDYAGPGTPGSTSPAAATETVATAWASFVFSILGNLPLAPTLVAPAYGAYSDLQTNGGPFSWTYNSGGAVGGQTQYKFRQKISGGSYNYWNAGSGAFQSTELSNASAAGTLSFPAAQFTDGNTYNWSVATIDASGTGPYASDFTTNAQLSPSVTVTAPSGTVANTQTPTASWSISVAPGAVQGTYRVVTYSKAQYSAGGFSPGSGTSVDDSGVVTSLSTSYVTGVLPDNSSCRTYVQITESPGGQASSWSFSSFTVQADAPSAPTGITAQAGTDPATGCPRLTLQAQCQVNLLTANDSSFEGGIGTWQDAGNAGLYQEIMTVGAPDSPSSLQMFNRVAGTMDSKSGLYAVLPSTPYTAVANICPGPYTNNSRNPRISITWYDSTQTLISTTAGTATNTLLRKYAQIYVTASSPVNAAYASITVEVQSTAGGLLLDSGPNAATLQTPAPNGVSAIPFATPPFVGGAGFAGTTNPLAGPGGTVNAQGAVTGTAFTAECRANMTFDAGFDQWVLSRWNTANEWLIYVPTGTNHFAFKWLDSGSVLHSATGTTTIVRGTTYYAVALTWDGTTVRMFVNGTLDASSAAATAKAPTSQPLLIGLLSGQSQDSWPTMGVDEVRISNNARYTANYTVSGVAFTTDANTGCLYHLDAEANLVDAVGLFPGSQANLLAPWEANFEGSNSNQNTGSWASLLNVAVPPTSTQAQALDGLFSMQVQAAAAGASSAYTSALYVVTAGQQYTGIASFRSAATPNPVQATLNWYKSDGTPSAVRASDSSSFVSDTTTGWTQRSVTAIAPSDAVFARLVVTFTASGASEVHYVDQCGILVGSQTTWAPSIWTLGGWLPTAGLVLLRSDGLYVRGASTASPAALPSGQLVTVYDYELVPGATYSYTAAVYVPLGTSNVLSLYSSSVSGSIATGQGWWEFDPLNVASAINAQAITWNPSQVEQSTGHVVLGQATMNVLAFVMNSADVSATFEVFKPSVYASLLALCTSQKTLFISDPFGIGPWYQRFAIQQGGMGGNKAHDSQLLPSSAVGAHRIVNVTGVAQPRPAV